MCAVLSAVSAQLPSIAWGLCSLSSHKPAVCCSSWPSLAQTGSYRFYPSWNCDILLCRLNVISALMQSIRLLKNGSVMCFTLHWVLIITSIELIPFRKQAHAVKWNSLHCLVIWLSLLIRPIKKDKIESGWRLDFLTHYISLSSKNF